MKYSLPKNDFKQKTLEKVKEMIACYHLEWDYGVKNALWLLHAYRVFKDIREMLFSENSQFFQNLKITKISQKQ